MLKVFKYGLKLTEVQEVDLPVGAKILAVGEQYSDPKLWALVNPDASIEKRTIYCAGTGHQVSDDFTDRRHISTVQFNGGTLVFHFWE